MYETREMRAIMAGFLKEAMERDPEIILMDADLARANGTLHLFSLFPDRCFHRNIRRL